jgi:uncharacterized membrane protein
MNLWLLEPINHRVEPNAATITWPVGSRKPKTMHLSHLAGRGALDGAFWGMLFGMIFFVPIFGIAIGAAYKR